MNPHSPTMKERLAADRAANAERRPYVAIALARALGIIGLLAAAATGCAMILGSMGCTELPFAPYGANKVPANTSSAPREARCSTGAMGGNAVAVGPFPLAMGDGSPARGLSAMPIGDGSPARGVSYAGSYLVLRAAATGYEPVVIDARPPAQRKLSTGGM